MRCYKCQEIIPPISIKQLYRSENEVKIELECFNPNCRALNVVSLEFYLHAREDYFHHTKIKDIALTSKLPGEMNVIFDSMERSGISWIVRILDYEHRYVFNKPIKYSPEISRGIAIRKRFPLPKGWCCVYEVDPRELLEREYDRVVLVQRPLEVTRFVIYHYGFSEQMSYEEFKIEKATLNQKIDDAYHLLFDDIDKIKDSRLIHIHLADLNNYSTIAFNSLMDALNFPKNFRSNIFPVNPPERNWQVFSTILGKDEEVGGKLKRLHAIQNKYDYGLLEVEYQQKHIPPKGHFLRDYSYKNNTRFCTPKLNNFERHYQRGQKYRLAFETPDALEAEEIFKILVIGPEGNKYNCHLSENMPTAFQHLGHETIFIPHEHLIQFGKEQQLSHIIKRDLKGETPDLLFHNECRTKILNDINLPHFYFHTGWYLPPQVENANIYYFRNTVIPKAYKQKGVITELLAPAVNPEFFYPKPKEYMGVHGIGYRRVWERWLGWDGSPSMVGPLYPFVETMMRETQDFKNQGFHYFESPIKDQEYRKLLQRVEAFNPIISYGEYLSRRVFEGMACKTLMLYRLDFTLENGIKNDSVHRDMFKRVGYIPNKHFIEIKNNREIKEIWESLSENDKEEMRELAYETTLKQNTHVNRAKQILDDFTSGRYLKGKGYEDTEEAQQLREERLQQTIREVKEMENELCFVHNS